MENNIKFENFKKIIIFGGKKVGKTSLISKINDMKFNEIYTPSKSKFNFFK